VRRLAALAATSALVVAIAAGVGPVGSDSAPVAVAPGVRPLGSDPAPLRVHDVIRGSLGAVPSMTRRATASWCGAASQVERAPNTVAGNPVHWVYAIPSDSQDRLATLGSVMQTDAEETDAWWRAQDPTRAPRNDLSQFACGPQLDITTVRLTESTAQLAPLGGRFAAMFNALGAAGLRSSFTKYIVYYDAPVDDDDVCGQGGSDSSGFGLAVVYYQSCVGVSTAAVGAHELLHTLGAVPQVAPSHCPDENDGHTCDDPNDLMYPSISDVPLSSKVLDPGKNDYYGHGGAWLDTQDSAWLVRLDSQAPLTVSVSGSGSVTADVPGLQCAETCTTTWNSGTRLALQATPGPGAKLVRWGSACVGAGGCAVTVAPGASVSALFAPASFRLSVAISGRGAVRSSTAGITCRPRCAASFPSFTSVRLTATPAKAWKLRGWSGACRGSNKTCTVAMSAAASARATFVRA
jgi:Divergent InlB B-repeat domain